MEAIKATRENLEYVINYVVKDAPWAADFVNMFETNLANEEWTYVYTIVRGTGERAKTFYYTMTASKFNETFVFTNGKSPWSLMPIVNK